MPLRRNIDFLVLETLCLFDDFEKIIEVPTMSEAKRGPSLIAQKGIKI